MTAHCTNALGLDQNLRVGSLSYHELELEINLPQHTTCWIEWQEKQITGCEILWNLVKL